MPDLIKLGCTRKHPLQRARELGAGTGIPNAFVLAYYRDFADCFLAESLVHQWFEESRVNESREFFQISLEDAIAYIDSLPMRTDYREQLSSEGVVGGERLDILLSTPWTDLFATFDPNGPDELTEAEQAQCRALRQRLNQ